MAASRRYRQYAEDLKAHIEKLRYIASVTEPGTRDHKDALHFAHRGEVQLSMTSGAIEALNRGDADHAAAQQRKGTEYDAWKAHIAKDRARWGLDSNGRPPTQQPAPPEAASFYIK